MENDKWSWFAGGVVLGLLLGLGIAGSYGFSQMQQARAEAERLAEEAAMQRMRAEEEAMRALESRRIAELEVERARKMFDELQKNKKDK